MTLDRRRLITAVAATATVAGLGPTRAAAAERPSRPLVFGHRGASALRPEHTLGSYAKAIEDGADFVEPDLVSTRDGVLVVRHENDISGTTDVAEHPEFAARKTTKTVDGEKITGWFSEDFTFAELKTLRAVERLPQVRPGSAAYDGHFQIVSLEEMIDFVAAEAAARGRVIGIVPEFKHSTYFTAIGLAPEDKALAVLASHPYTRTAPVVLQSFEVANLKALRPKIPRGGNIKLMQLTGAPQEAPGDVMAARGGMTYGQMTTPAGFKEMATYADIFAPPTRAVIPLGPDERLTRPTGVVQAAHAAGLLVAPWTFRPENQFLAADFSNGAGPNARNPEGSLAEIRRYLAEGLDGFFTDDPAIGRLAVG